MNSRLTKIYKSYINSYQGLTFSCWSGIILSLIESIFIGIYNFLPLYFINELHFTVMTSDSIISFYGVGAILGSYIVGKFSDNYSPAKISIYCIFIQACVLLALIKIKIRFFLMAILFVTGFASYGFITANYLMVLTRCENENQKLKSLSLLSTASNLGLGISALIISSFSKIGFSSLFFISSLLLVACGIIFQVFTKQVKEHQKFLFPPDDKYISYHASTLLLIYSCVFLVGLIIFQAANYSIFIEKTFPQLGLKGVGYLFALNCFLVVFLQTPIVNYFSNQNKLILCGIGALLLGLSMVLLNFAFVFSIAILACLINTLGEILFFSASQFICYENSPASQKGRNLGIYKMVYATSRIAGPVTGGFIYQHCGANLLWYCCGLCGIISLIACYFFKVNFALEMKGSSTKLA